MTLHDDAAAAARWNDPVCNPAIAKRLVETARFFDLEARTQEEREAARIMRERARHNWDLMVERCD